MEIRTTTQINEKDLKKMMKEKGIKSFYKLAQVSGVSEQEISRWRNGHLILSENAWKKIKSCL